MVTKRHYLCPKQWEVDYKWIKKSPNWPINGTNHAKLPRSAKFEGTQFKSEMQGKLKYFI